MTNLLDHHFGLVILTIVGAMGLIPLLLWLFVKLFNLAIDQLAYLLEERGRHVRLMRSNNYRVTRDFRVGKCL